MVNKEDLEENLKKLLVRLNNLQEGKQMGTMVQIIQDILFLAYSDCAAELFQGKDVHVPLMLVLTFYTNSKVHQVGWSLMCRLMELCPTMLDKFVKPLNAGKDWEVLGVHQQILKVLSLHQKDSKVMIVALQALSLLLKSDELVVMLLEEEMDVFELVVEAMCTFPHSEEVQLQSCSALRPLLERVPEEHLMEFIERKDHAAVLSALSRFKESESVVLSALQVLIPLAGPASNVEILMSKTERCYSLLCQAAVACSHSEAVQEVACRLLQKFTSESYFNILVLNDVHRVAVKACLSYPDNAPLQAASLSCLALLTKTIVENKYLERGCNEEKEGRVKIAGDGGGTEAGLVWREACCTALDRHAEDAEVQEAACWALNSLMLYGSAHDHIYVEPKGRPPIHTQIMAIMLLHSLNVGVFQAATATLGTLVRRHSKMRSLLLSHGIHYNILELMKRHSSSSEVCVSACRFLHVLFQGGRRLGLDDGIMALGRILVAMRDHNFEPEVQLVGLRASLVLLNPDRRLREHGVSVADPDTTDVGLRVLKNQCLVEKAHTVYLEALNRFISSVDIQECGLAVLSVLSDCSGAVDLMCQQGAIDTVLHTLQMFPQKREIHFWGLSLLFHLISKKKLSHMMVPVLASVLVSCVRWHKEDGAVLLKGFQVIWKLLDTSSGAAVELEKEGFEKDIFQQLRETSRDQRYSPLQKLSCLCLSKMVVDSEICYRLLERVCEEEDVVMAECLIQLGADVNKKTKTDSLIYQVCERGGPLALVEILVSCGVREQQLRLALGVCVRRGDGPVVTLLLGRLGLDPANSALCLGGFRLGHVKASWLSALLSDRRLPPTVQTKNNKGRCLARQILALQKKRGLGLSRLEGDVNSSEYFSDEESDDPSHISLDDSLVFAFEDLVSDESDGPAQGQQHYCDSPDELRGRAKTRQQGQRRRAISEGSHCEPHHNQSLKNRLSRNGQIHRVLSDRSSTGGLLSGMDRDYIRLLDLSGNELDSLSCFMEDTTVQQQLKHLLRLDLSSNSLSDFPRSLCESLRSLTRLDLQGNKLQSLPAELLSLPSLSMLSVSRNCIGPLLFLDPHVHCPALRQLNLSFNDITAFPSQLHNAMENLEELSLEGNQISELSLPLSLAELKVLDVSKNEIAIITDDFLAGCSKMETFNASINKLSYLLYLPSKISTLKLSENIFRSIPKAVVKLPNLRSVDMRRNSIRVLPGPPVWASANLRELIFSHNQISVLNLGDSVSTWARLVKLHLSHNKLTELPPQIGLLEELTSLDVSANVGLRSFPDELGRLGRLWDLPLDGLELQLDLKHIGTKTKDIVRYFQQRLKKAVPYFRVKLIVVGSPGSGKTTLIQQLMKLRHSHQNSNMASTGIRVTDWTIRDRDRRSMVLNIWDFPGGEEHCNSHAHFMNSRALYLVLYDLSKGIGELDALKPWLFNIKALAPVSPVIVVGTHLDVCENTLVQECVRALREQVLSCPSFPAIRENHMLCACEESDSISRLRKAIAREARGFKIQGQPVMGQLVPDCYVELERRLLQERSRVPAEFPVLRHKRLLQLILESQLQLDDGEIPHAIHFLSETGVLFHFDDPALQLKDLYFVNPQWLCTIISQTLRSSSLCESTGGVVQRSGLERFLSENHCFPKDLHMQYFKLLEKFQIALPFGEEEFLVPSSLSDKRPDFELPHCENSEVIVRVYEMPYFPMGYWSRQINRLLEFSSFMLYGREKVMRPDRIYWRTGVYLNWSADAYCLVEASSVKNNPASFVKITVPCSRKGHVLLGQLVDHIDSVLEEWFPSLLNTDIHGDGETLLKKWALYSFDDSQEWSKMQLEELLKHVDKDGLLVKPEDPHCTIPISQICPDLDLSDQPASTMLDPEELELDLSKEYLLGDGGFGSVYRAAYKNEDVAVKIFNKHASELYVHRLVRQELVVLSRLRHPSLVGLMAAGSCPHLLVMELAPCGSLDSLFQHENGSLNRKLQHRIALQVADGLRYLHSCMIIYRDLKPHNVLLFNLKADSEIIAKITDYGIAQYCCSMGVKSSEGTPGFRAPEVARGNVIYNVQADVYSFGLLLYDIMTCGERISDGVKFPSEFDEIAVQRKLPDPVEHYGCAPWPRFQSLMRDCLRENPQDRPTSSQVFDRLNSGEMLCLNRELTFCGLPCECFVVSNAADGLRGSENGVAGTLVWMGGRSSSKRLGCVTCVDLQTEKSSTREIDRSPVLCLVTIRVPEEDHDWLIAGTQQGSLVVMDTRNATVLHCLKSVKDAVTSLFFHTPSQRSCLKKYLLVGTADGKLVIYEDSVIKCADGGPVKVWQVGSMTTPLMCLALSGHSQDRNTIWAGCGTRVFSLAVDYSVSRIIDTRPTHLHHPQKPSSSVASISRLVVEKHVYLSKTGGHSVEVWDKKTGKMIALIDCVQLLSCSLNAKVSSSSMPREMGSSWFCVKALLVQQNSTLWIGTRAGHILLVDLATHQLLQTISPGCHSVRSMAPALIDTQSRRSVILVLGRHLRMSQNQIKTALDDVSVLIIWNSALPQEVKHLKGHCEQRQHITAKIREQAYN
ncbi:leucine-rich repeat serine/threonine-protein kinase 2 isoform X2 [Electrophorus electricus]|uniref:leucine-rich repeat serine/threonine-protein kinase 2 isoform X2 n=1 Tax=Electrophorus electricus TaxID=8005 RepID=UPI0015D016B4|nr:leucine-rich repeat serine/threonine-protein kinase 2 isoform X2 [Electrophorus electricus]